VQCWKILTKTSRRKRVKYFEFSEVEGQICKRINSSLKSVVMLKTIAFFAFLCLTLPQRPILAPAFQNLNDTETVTCILPASASFEGRRTSSTTASLDWSAVSGAAAYKLKVYVLGTSTLFSETTEGGLSKTLSGLQAGVSYRCELAAICSDQTVSGFIIVVDVIA
jgi:hypothetical protein